MRAVDSAIHTQSAQSQKDCIFVRLSSDGCGDQFVTAKVQTLMTKKVYGFYFFILY